MKEQTIESVREEIKRRESEGETENWDLGLCCLKSKVEGYELAQKEFLDKLEKYKCGKHKKLKNILKKSLSEDK